MKRLSAIMLLALLLASCSERWTDEEGSFTEERKVEFILEGNATRASVSSHEGDVSSVDFLVFYASNGILLTDARFTGSELGSMSLELPVGVPLRWYVVANVPSGKFAGVVSESGFRSGLTYLSESTASSLVMYASDDLTVSAESNAPVIIGLDRYCCKVTLDGFRMSWLDTFATPPAVTVEKAVIINAVGSCPLSGVPAVGTQWYNMMGVDPSLGGVVSDMLVCDFGSLEVQSSGTLSLDCSLYCLPNPTGNAVNSATSPAWSARNTRFALLLLIDGVENWYSVDLPGMLCNRNYVISDFNVLGPGASSPDEPLERSGITASVSVIDWAETNTYLDF